MSWTPVDNNCGTGAGGFKKGNSCRWGGVEELADSLEGLAKVLGVEGKGSDRPSPYGESYQKIFRDEAGPDGGWYALQKAEQYERKLHKSLEDHGFTPQEGSLSTFNHPHGHYAQINITMPASNRAVVKVYMTYMPKANREGFMATTDALETSIKANGGNFSGNFPITAYSMARHGRHVEAAVAHQQAAEEHERSAKNSKGAARKLQQQAADLHRIAYDWYAERAGMQNNRAWSKIS